jgi:hypothetical protein
LRALEGAAISADREAPVRSRPIVYFDEPRHAGPLSVRRALSGKGIMLIGVTGFIGKVWLANTLLDLPEIGKLYLLIRRQKSNPGRARFEKMVEESPVFDPLFERYAIGSAPILRKESKWWRAMFHSRNWGWIRKWRRVFRANWTSSSTVRG